MALRTTLITSPEQLTDYAEQWETLRRATGCNSYSGVHLSKVWLECFSTSATSQVVIIEDHRDLVAIAPLAMSRLKVMGLSLRTLALIGGVPHSLRLVTNSVMVLPERQGALERMIDQMKRLDWSVLWTQNMGASDAVTRYLSAAHHVWHTKDQVPNINIVLPIAESGEVDQEFSKHARKTLGKTLRMIEREGHELLFRKVPFDGIDRAVEIYAHQHIERWKTRGGSSFSNPQNIEFLKRATATAYMEGFGIAYELILDGEVIGQLIGFRDGDRADMYRFGMSNAHMRFSPGWLLWYHALIDLRDQGVRSCLLGGGEEQYKYEMGGQQTQLMGLQATRGVASLSTRVMESAAVQRLDAKLGISKRALDLLSVERAETDPLAAVKD